MLLGDPTASLRHAQIARRQIRLPAEATTAHPVYVIAEAKATRPAISHHKVLILGQLGS